MEEAEELRQGGIRKPLLILGYTYEENYEQIAREEFRPAVFKLSMARKLSQAAVKNNTVVNVHIKIDTGMSRIGYRDLETAVPEIMEISRLPGIRIEGLFTHFARADEKKTDPAYVQFRKFQEFQKALEAQGLEIPICHCSNSAGIIRMPEANLNAVRAGVILYGLYPSEDVEKEPVPPQTGHGVKEPYRVHKNSRGRCPDQLWGNLYHPKRDPGGYHSGRICRWICQRSFK